MVAMIFIWKFVNVLHRFRRHRWKKIPLAQYPCTRVRKQTHNAKRVWVSEWGWKTSEFKCQKQIDIESEWLPLYWILYMQEQSKRYSPPKKLIYFNLYFHSPTLTLSLSLILFHSIIEIRVLFLHYFLSFSRIVYVCARANSGTKCYQQASKRPQTATHSYMYVRCKSKSTQQMNENEIFCNHFQSISFHSIRFNSILLFVKEFPSKSLPLSLSFIHTHTRPRT